MTLKELLAKKAELAASIKDIGSRQADWADVDREAWAKVNEDYEANEEALAAEQARVAEAKEVEERLAAIEQQTAAANGQRRIGLDAGERRDADPERQLATQNDARAIGLQAWLRAGRGLHLSPEQRQACRAAGFDPTKAVLELSIPSFRYGKPAWVSNNATAIGQRELRAGLDVGTGGAGLETIPQGFVAELEKTLLAYSSVRNVCRVVQTDSGNALPWPVVDDTGNSGALLAEATTIGTSVDPTFSAVTFNAYKYSSKPVFISQELLEDSAFNLASEIAMLLGTRLGRAEAAATTTGTGSSQPKGIVTCAGTGVTTASATAWTADELIKLVHSVDPALRSLPSAGFMMHDSALAYCRFLKDANGAYLWAPGLQIGVPDRLLGYPVSVNQSMEALSSYTPVTAKKHVLFGAFEKYVIRDVASLRLYRLDERYRDTDQTAFIAFKRMDADTIQAGGLKVMLQA